MGRVREKGSQSQVQDKMGRFFSYYLGSLYYESEVLSSKYYPSYVRTVDEVHPNHPWDGGPFDSRSISTSFSDQGCPLGGTFYYHPVLNRWVTSGYAFQGTYRLDPKWSSGVPSSCMSLATARGPEAWNKFKPGKPDVGLAQFIAELKDIANMKMDFKYAHNFLRGMKKQGKNYLAAQFGWKPFVQDLRSLYSSIRKIDNRIAQLRKLNGQWHRRGGTLFIDESNSSSSGTDNIISPGNYLTSKGWSVDTKSTTRCWFQGSFRYFIPGLDDPKWGRLKAIQELWDLSITPELLWELMPWSWLADWFGDVGNIISNFQSQISDQVTARYAYVMYQTDTETKWKADAINRYTSTYNVVQYNPVHCEAVFRQTAKTRAEASPFGFGIDIGNLSWSQMSILAALGLSKMKT